MVTSAGARYAVGAVKADAAREAWERERAHAVVAAARSVAVHTDGPLSPGAPVARIVAPRIGLDAIVLEGVDDDALNAGPGHVRGSAIPGAPGNAIISAHRDRHFHGLDRLAVGDTIVTETGARQTTWVVTSRRVIDKNAPALFHTSDATLTLTTCWPMAYVGPAPQRLIVTATVSSR